jgi:hypothetical protein
LLATCNFNAGVRKELTVYTSCAGGGRLREKMIGNLKSFNRDRESKVERISDLDLTIEDVEKVVEYRYMDVKYF